MLAAGGLAAALLAAPLAAGPLVSDAAAAAATFNPFDVNNGFTLYVSGDAILGNGEIEGSIAADGAISSTNQNGYPVVHQVAGLPDYTVPVIDGIPVRILAAGYAGAGGFEVSNRNAPPGSPEATASVKLVSTAGLTGSSRGSNFLRVTNSDGGNLDLPTTDYQPGFATDLSLLAADQNSVAAYFPQKQAQLDRTSRCLADIYDPATGLGTVVPVDDRGSMVMPGPYAADKPNVLNYGDIAGRTIKPDNAGGYSPTADAPLIIKVPAGTTQLGRLNFEGWSSSGNGQQLARYIFLDLSEVTGSVVVDGLEMGAVYAPNANLAFNSSITHNGQWLTGSFTASGAGELHHHAFLGNLPCAATAPVNPTTGPTPSPTDSPTTAPTTTPSPTDSPTTAPTTTPAPTGTATASTTPSPEPTRPSTTRPSTTQPGTTPGTSTSPSTTPVVSAPALGGPSDPAPSDPAPGSPDQTQPVQTPAAGTGSALAATGSAGAVGIGSAAVLLLATGAFLLFGTRKGKHS
ncbi:choice-of-anchor A family protein [Arthrobacter sp. Sa2BUA2]|uniref:Choice-of-anchor A family protein n=1 Tax=Arthrobacter pullicola TaxID=2762224 RepID=A0ABR8YGJ0_9MICC|nr:collagen-binding domain-containing protein [Arthrobacter pullicola]MBD8043327.1 choice-of-anchor A family protein [Arthrobacter pullicola]